MGRCFKNTQNKKQQLLKKQIKKKHAKQNCHTLQLFFMANFDRVNRSIDMRVWKGCRFENILKLDCDLG